MKLTKTALKQIIREELLAENKGKSEAVKILNKWKRSLFPKLSEGEMWGFGSTMREFFKEYK